MNIKSTLGIGVTCIIIGLAWSVRHYYQQSTGWHKQAQEARILVERQIDELKLLQRQQRVLAELDEHYTEKLNDAEHENTSLRAQLASGHRRMYIARDSASQVSSTPPRRVGDDATIGLPTNTGQHVLSVREGIIRDQQKLMYLQNYIRQVCLQQDAAKINKER